MSTNPQLTQERIAKYTKALNQINALIINGKYNSNSCKYVIRSLKCNGNIIFISVK